MYGQPIPGSNIIDLVNDVKIRLTLLRLLIKLQDTLTIY